MTPRGAFAKLHAEQVAGIGILAAQYPGANVALGPMLFPHASVRVVVTRDFKTLFSGSVSVGGRVLADHDPAGLNG